jgi:hypothetical protein
MHRQTISEHTFPSLHSIFLPADCWRRNRDISQNHYPNVSSIFHKAGRENITHIHTWEHLVTKDRFPIQLTATWKINTAKRQRCDTHKHKSTRNEWLVGLLFQNCLDVNCNVWQFTECIQRSWVKEQHRYWSERVASVANGIILLPI